MSPLASCSSVLDYRNGHPPDPGAKGHTPPTEVSNPLSPGRTAGSEFKILPSSCPCTSGESLKKPKQKNQAWDSFVRTTQQNKIPVYCWTTLFHTYIKQAKKINSNFIDKKRKKRNLLSLAFLTISYKPTTYSTAKYIHKKSYWNARNKIVFFCCCFCFFYKVFFLLWDYNEHGHTTSKVRVGQRTLRRLVWSSEIIKNGWPLTICTKI